LTLDPHAELLLIPLAIIIPGYCVLCVSYIKRRKIDKGDLNLNTNIIESWKKCYKHSIDTFTKDRKIWLEDAIYEIIRAFNNLNYLPAREHAEKIFKTIIGELNVKFEEYTGPETNEEIALIALALEDGIWEKLKLVYEKIKLQEKVKNTLWIIGGIMTCCIVLASIFLLSSYLNYTLPIPSLVINIAVCILYIILFLLNIPLYLGYIYLWRSESK
jgi:hypothetical protein